ncbi:HNH endonuclease family protein [Pseudoflavitalea rhizosphaerae]|uniref:HNH endonuclease family protein n=1 Tax=Pseudoflavitalea rhizosphaerae TaxID=1884793 RepID=UPI000F8C67BE|nr:DUF262 domain-containing protein [Pseudoflavitalea rhizosphaerae]
MPKVNLDALIPREDFEIIKEGEINVPNSQTVTISELELGKPWLAILRKPDFQRETNEWSPEAVFDLIKSFLNDDLIPSIILWNSGSRNFVIDGAHRLSALIAWVTNDYGNGVISSPFFGHNVSSGQKQIAQLTKNLVDKNIGTYEEHKWALNNPDKAEPEMLKRANRLPNLTLTLQWVKGNFINAENSFFKINESPAPINDTERSLLKSRRKPNAIAARAIIRSGTGHKYWSYFEDATKKNEIERLATEINQMLFKPELENSRKTLEVPLGGKGYSAGTLPLVFDMVNLCNSIEQRVIKKTNELAFIEKNGENEINIEDDITGDKTIQILKKTRKIIYRICSDHASSLGLHPQVYFYSTTGRYQITALLAIIELIKDFEKAGENRLEAFINVRKQFEEFLINNKIFINQSTVHTGSGLKGYRHLKKLLLNIIENLEQGKSTENIIDLLTNDPEFNYLNPKQSETKYTKRKNFDPETKNAVYITKLYKAALRCSICGGFAHPNSSTVDHLIRKKDSGLGNFANADIAHPYCNTTIKN